MKFSNTADRGTGAVYMAIGYSRTLLGALEDSAAELGGASASNCKPDRRIAPHMDSGPPSIRYMARQPILDCKGHVHGYELLFREGPSQAFSGDGDMATRDVLDQAATMGLNQLTSGSPVFINCTREALIDRLVMVMPPDRTILELLETLEPTADILEMCYRYKEAGFRIALDDFHWTPAWDPFVEIADYIKVDISVTTSAERIHLVQRLQQRSPTTRVNLVAERVETPEDVAMVQSEGFNLFQGYYFCKPVLLQNRRIPVNHLIHMQMIKALHENPLPIATISDLVKRDLALTFKLLRMVNSPLYGLRKTVTSIRAALVLIGDEMFRRVATLAIASELKGNHPSELLRMSFLRGRFCELAAAYTGQDETEQYLLGVLSLFGAMLSVSMESIAEALPLRAEIRDALLGTANSERTALDWVTHFELGEWESCDAISLQAGLKSDIFPKAYSEAMAWSEANMTLAR